MKRMQNTVGKAYYLFLAHNEIASQLRTEDFIYNKLVWLQKWRVNAISVSTVIHFEII